MADQRGDTPKTIMDRVRSFAAGVSGDVPPGSPALLGTGSSGGAPPIVRALTEHLKGELMLELSQPGTGRLYKRGKKEHRASAPGEPPTPDTGTLRNSIGTEYVDGAGYVGTHLKYGRYLEYGTETIKPRPWMSTVADWAKKNLATLAAQAADASRGGGDVGS